MKHAFGTKRYFDELYGENNEPWSISIRESQKYRFKQYFKLLNNHNIKSNNCLDVGCSLGQFTINLLSLSLKVIGVDISKDAIIKCNSQYKNIKNIQFEFGKLPKLSYSNNSFDLITCLEVLYYLSDNDKRVAILELYRVLDKKGYILFSVVLDKKPYFKFWELEILMELYFKIIETKYLYSNLYYPLESFLLRLFQFHNKLTKKCGLLKLFWPLFYIYTLLMKLYLKWWFPITFNNFIGNLLFAKNKAQNVIILARKK